MSIIWIFSFTLWINR